MCTAFPRYDKRPKITVLYNLIIFSNTCGPMFYINITQTLFGIGWNHLKMKCSKDFWGIKQVILLMWLVTWKVVEQVHFQFLYLYYYDNKHNWMSYNIITYFYKVCVVVWLIEPYGNGSNIFNSSFSKARNVKNKNLCLMIIKMDCYLKEYMLGARLC